MPCYKHLEEATASLPAPTNRTPEHSCICIFNTATAKRVSQSHTVDIIDSVRPPPLHLKGISPAFQVSVRTPASHPAMAAKTSLRNFQSEIDQIRQREVARQRDAASAERAKDTKEVKKPASRPTAQPPSPTTGKAGGANPQIRGLAEPSDVDEHIQVRNAPIDSVASRLTGSISVTVTIALYRPDRPRRGAESCCIITDQAQRRIPPANRCSSTSPPIILQSTRLARGGGRMAWFGAHCGRAWHP